MDLVYERWSRSFYGNLPTAAHISLCLPYLSLRARKAVLLYTRVQQPLTGSRLARSVSAYLEDRMTLPPVGMDDTTRCWMSVKELLASFPHSPSDPIFQGWLSMMVRNAPSLDYEDVIVASKQTVIKEIKAAVGCYHPIALDYTGVLGRDGPGDRHVRMAPNLPLDPKLNATIFDAFQRTIPKLQSRLFYPRTSTKTIGKVAQQEAEGMLRGVPEVFSRFPETLSDVERVYHETGFQVQGPVEMRMAYKYNDLKPRVYYAQGPTVYHASKYIQAVFNIIIDEFPPVHRFDRYELPSETILDAETTLFVYDYASFTSSLHEILGFLRALAVFYRGVEIDIVDSVEGVQKVDLGLMLEEYVEVCCEDPEFDAHRVLEFEEDIMSILRHNCGMLGVPGNITSCTLLHGIHLSIILRSLFAGRSVGDDAMGQIRVCREGYRWAVFVNQVQNIGEVSEEKFERFDRNDENWEVDGWHYIKRPITRIGDRIYRGTLFIWPSIANLLGLKDAIHTEIPLPIEQRRRKFLNQWKRLLTLLHVSSEPIPEPTRQLLHQFQVSAYRFLGIPRSTYGFWRSSPGFVHVVPSILSSEDFGKDWVKKTMGEMTLGYHRLPAFRCEDDWFTGVQCERFLHRGSVKLAYLEKLGYLRKDGIEWEDILFDAWSTSAYVRFYLQMDYSFMHQYEVVKDFPAFADQLY